MSGKCATSVMRSSHRVTGHNFQTANYQTQTKQRGQPTGNSCGTSRQHGHPQKPPISQSHRNNEGWCHAVHVRPYSDDRPNRDNKLVNIVAGFIEGTGAVFAAVVSVVWAWHVRGMWQVSALLLIVFCWCVSNVWYATAYVLRQYGIEIWSHWSENVAELLQQASQVALPLSAVAVFSRGFRARRAVHAQ